MSPPAHHQYTGRKAVLSSVVKPVRVVPFQMKQCERKRGLVVPHWTIGLASAEGQWRERQQEARA